MKIVIDCDPGVDDMQAILMAFRSPDAEILAITTCGGNGSSDRVYKNAKKICDFCGRKDVPVFKGPKMSLAGFPHCTDSYFGADSIGEIELADVDEPDDNTYAAHKLVEIVKQHKGEVVLVALGPLTNIACAHYFDNDFCSYLKDMYVMGGDIAEKTTWNVTDYAEFNAWCDPTAFNLVMKNFKLNDGKPIKVVDFDFCRKHLIPITHFEDYYQVNLPVKKENLRSKMARFCYNFMSSKMSPNGIVTADTFVMYLALHPQVKYQSSRCNLKSICLEGEKVGHTSFDDDPSGSIDMVKDFDMDHFLMVLKDSVED